MKSLLKTRATKSNEINQLRQSDNVLIDLGGAHGTYVGNSFAANQWYWTGEKTTLQTLCDGLHTYLFGFFPVFRERVKNVTCLETYENSQLKKHSVRFL